MILSTTHRVENIIVNLLARKRALSAAQLHELITAEHRAVSVQAVYKELRKLIADGVIWKRRGEYCLSASWVLNFSELADTMYHTLTESPAREDIIPADGEKTKFHFSNLARLDDFWINSLIVLLQNSPSKRMYQWLPHPWFYLIHSHKSPAFQNALTLSGFYVQSIIGGVTFLDRWAEKFNTPGVYEYSYASGPYEEKQGAYLSVTDRYLQTVTIDPDKVAAIEEVYQSVDSFDEVDIGGIVEAINLPCKVSVTIETNPRKVRRVWKQLREYFEV